jgi:hypothetical protein
MNAFWITFISTEEFKSSYESYLVSLTGDTGQEQPACESRRAPNFQPTTTFSSPHALGSFQMAVDTTTQIDVAAYTT